MIPTRVGQRVPGGVFAGINRIRSNAYAVVVSPKWSEHFLQWKSSDTFTANAQSINDGFSNSNAMNTHDYSAAQYCLGLTIEHCNDFYLPSINELELCYRSLKPVSRRNFTCLDSRFSKPLHRASGTNVCSVPTGNPYTNTNPAMTIATAFTARSAEAFDTYIYYWSSTETSSIICGSSLFQIFSSGKQL